MISTIILTGIAIGIVFIAGIAIAINAMAGGLKLVRIEEEAQVDAAFQSLELTA
jgi:hypothetical protein